MEQETFFQRFINNFKIFEEKEDYDTVTDVIEKGIHFKGTNLWVLIFAIFIASLGLNVNSTAVIIGAMLISPLMGPIMGIGFGLAISNFQLTNVAIRNYLFATFIGLLTSSLYFGITPLNEAHSELLARTSPNFYDVLIAFFGGLAGIIATSSKLKGNVIPGVAIATALMPPLCTGGYGIATGNWTFMAGALYLFFINTVFIALATFLTVRILNFPIHHLTNPKRDIWAQRVVTSVVMLTLIPSIYLAYEMVQKERFLKNANRYIEQEANIEGDYLLSKKIDSKKKSIELIYGGNPISENQQIRMKERLKFYNLEDASLKVRLGFALSNNDEDKNRMLSLVEQLNKTEEELRLIKEKMDSVEMVNSLIQNIRSELNVYYPEVKEVFIGNMVSSKQSDSTSRATRLVVVDFNKYPGTKEVDKLKAWLKVRLNDEHLRLIVQ